MKQLRIGIWIFVLMLIQTVISKYVNAGMVVGNVLFAFATVYSVYCEYDAEAFLVGMICALVYASMSTRPFFMTTLMFAYGIAVTRLLSSRRNKVGNVARAVIYTLVLSTFFETAIYALLNFSMDKDAVIYIILPVSVMNAVYAAIIAFVYKRLPVQRKSISFIQ